MQNRTARDINIALIGGGYIGKTHAIAYRAHPVVFGGPLRPVLYLLAEQDPDSARTKATALGFEKSTSDWREAVTDPRVDVVAIATPNARHKDMALAAIAAGKHVYCEKPLALNASEAREMATAANRAGVVHMVGYNYLLNPVISLAKQLIDRGELGDILYFRGRHNEDYLADPAVPFNWRCETRQSGSGALGDLGSHIICMAMYLVGEIDEVTADLQTVIKTRPDAGGVSRAVENDDQAHCLARFEKGAMGFLETSRVALGRKLGLGFEITGTKGSLLFDQERMNELKLYRAGEKAGEQGFKTILVSPDHPDFAPFCPAPGHGLGYNDLKIIEVDRLLSAIAGQGAAPVDFQMAFRIEQVIDASLQSAGTGQWTRPSDM